MLPGGQEQRNCHPLSITTDIVGYVDFTLIYNFTLAWTQCFPRLCPGKHQDSQEDRTGSPKTSD